MVTVRVMALLQSSVESRDERCQKETSVLIKSHPKLQNRIKQFATGLKTQTLQQSGIGHSVVEASMKYDSGDGVGGATQRTWEPCTTIVVFGTQEEI